MSHKIVLIIEDHPGDLFLAKQAVKEADSTAVVEEISTFPFAEQYLQKIANQEEAVPDLLLLDLSISAKEDGLILLKYITEIPAMANTKLVIMTDNVNPENISKGYQLNVSQFEKKPMSSERIKEILSAELEDNCYSFDVGVSTSDKDDLDTIGNEYEIDVMILEDSNIDYVVLEKKLLQFNCVNTVSRLADADSFHEYFNDNSKPVPHLLFVDFYLEKDSGLDLVKEIKLSPTWKDIPLILLSGTHDERDFETGYSESIDAFEVKPISQNKLVKAIKLAVDKRYNS